MEKEEEDLDTAYPRDGRLRFAESLGVIFLKDAIAVCYAPGIEEDDVHEQDMHPGCEAAIGRITGLIFDLLARCTQNCLFCIA